MIEHTKRDHALLSASGSHRWMNCTPSALLENEFGVNDNTEYAAEGTYAHEFAEVFLSYRLLYQIDGLTDEYLVRYNDAVDNLSRNKFYSNELLDYVMEYENYCVSQFIALYIDDKSTEFQVEMKLDLSKYVPDSFGTADCVLVGNNTMEVIDLKYGAGVAVSAYNNTQLMLYALGAIEKFKNHNIENVTMTIVQPRMDNISSFTMTKQGLLNWAEEVLVPKAQQAIKGEGELRCGSWCQFCKVKERCRELYNKNMEVVNMVSSKTMDLLTDDEIADVVAHASQVKSWLETISEYAKNQAVEGKKFKGLKLVEGRSVRKWANDYVGVSIASRMNIPEESLYTKKLKGITDIEKMVGKKAFAEELSDLVVKPSGAPTLVPEDDKRPEIGGSILSDFGIK